jgi:hypothetical protein
VKRPDGTVLGSRTGVAALSVTLPTTGVHQLLIDPSDSRTGSLTFTLAATG